MLLMEMNILLAIGLLAILVIFLVARSMNDRGLFSWFKRFEALPDSGGWGRVDRELDAIPKLAGLDHRERREHYIQVSRSLDKWNSHVMWVFGLIGGASMLVIQPVATRLADAAIPLTAQNPVLSKLPQYLIASGCAGLLSVIPFLLLFRWRHAQIVRRIRRQASETSTTAVS